MTDTPIVNQLVLLLSFKNDFMFELLLVFKAPYVTINKIDGYYHFETEHLGDMGEMMSIDKDGDGDYDLVPKDVTVFCCYGSQYDFVSDLYWENTGGQFVRRIND